MFELVGEVVDELHLAGQRPLDAVDAPASAGEGLAGGAAERRRVDLDLDLPLHARLRARHGGGAAAPAAIVGSSARDRAREGGERA